MKTFLCSLASLTLWSVGFSQTSFAVVSQSPDTRVQFTSEAPLETVKGVTHTVTGQVELDPAGSGDGAKAEIHVDLASLKTGNGLRDRDMREDHLETSTYPEAVFTLTSLELPSGGLPEGKRIRVTVQGTLKLHGVEKSIAPESYLTLRHDGSDANLRIESSFVVKLADYQIKRPQFLLMRLAEEQHIEVDVRAVSRPGSASGTP